MMKCADCGKEIYASAEEEAIGGKHATVYDNVPYVICMPCSELPKYTHVGEDVPEQQEEPRWPTK